LREIVGAEPQKKRVEVYQQAAVRHAAQSKHPGVWGWQTFFWRYPIWCRNSSWFFWDDCKEE
jgi:hypothetical protein